MGIADLYAANLAKSSKTASADAIINATAAEIVAQRVTAELRTFTLEEKTSFLESLEDHGNVYRACLSVGISRRSALAARKRDALFADAWHEILEAKVDEVEQVLHEQCLDPSSANTVARIFYLKAARRDKYGEHVRVEHKHMVDVVVELSRPNTPRPDAEVEDIEDAEYEEL